jgi:energy-coupling factor transporter ATP-binding protein EcfA2
MFLKKFVFVNWGNIPNCEFDIGPVSLFSGANGSGKTTAADAIQTVMTAAHENLFHYNPGQDESSQRGRGGKRVRTLASYVLGCDDGSYARSATDGYIAAIFHPTLQETAEAFTAVVGVRAWLDRSGKQAQAQEDQSLFLILPGVELGLDGFVKDRAGVPHVTLLDDIQAQLVARLGKKSVEKYDQKRTYLRRLFGALRGKSDSVSEREAMAAARAFSRFMAYKPISSINQFVADEVLERKDLGEAVRSVSSQLKTIHGMEREAQELKDSAALLEKSGHHSQSYIETWIDLRTLACSTSGAVLLDWEAQHQKKLSERDSTERELASTRSQLELSNQRYAQLRDTVISLEAQRKGIPALQRKDALESERKAVNGKFAGTAATLLGQDEKMQRNLRSAQVLSRSLALPSASTDLQQVIALDSHTLVRRALETAALGDVDLPRYLQMDLTNDLALLENHLDAARIAQRAHNELHEFWTRREGADGCHRDTVADAAQLRRQRYGSLTSQLQIKQQEIQRLQAKQAVYPSYVDRALAAIRTQCPRADARVLCDHIEVTDPRWQSAIEGFMGGSRFGIMVDADYETQAIRIVRSLPGGRDNKARVIQGAKALRDAARVKLPADSVVHVLEFSHKVAEAYVIASYGSVVRVKSDEELPQIARGITADGKGSASYAMFRCDMPDADLVFGAFARERAIEARRTEVQRLDVERNEANAHVQEIVRLLDAIDGISALTYADALAELLALHRELRRIEMLLAQLDTSAFESLDAQLDALRREEQDLREHERGLNSLTGELGSRLAAQISAIQGLEEHKNDVLEAVARAREALMEAHGQWPEFDLAQRLKYAEEEAKSPQARRSAAEEHLAARLTTSEHDLTGTMLLHNQKCRPSDAVVFNAFNGRYDAAFFEQMCGLRREIDRIYNILKNNVLVSKHEQLKILKVSFNDAFVSHLCQEIHQSIQDGKRQLDLLNKELVNHRFGSDREQFRFAQEWVPEYRDYARFFEEVVRSPAIGTASTLFDSALSAKSVQVRDALMGLLLGADEKKSLGDLDRIADYRNYHRYEIYKEVQGKEPIALSEYGTGSGGQLETPAYIIRAASITSALRYAEGSNHLRMVLVDEAFSKMDESRSREVIDYLTGSLGLQLIFIMPTSKCGPFMDLISNEFVFAKVPSAPRGELLTRVIVDRKQCNQERIADLWTRHRRTVRQQAELDFMAELDTESDAG